MAKKDKEPPTDLARIELFRAAVDQYTNLREALPIVSPFSILHGAKDDGERWNTALHAMVLRKFYAADDELHLVKVLSAIEVVAAPLSAKDAAAVVTLKEAVVDQREVGGPWRVTPKGGGATTSFAPLVFDDLYGGLLHGDYGRWLRSKELAGRFSDHMMWDWATSGADLLYVVSDGCDNLVPRAPSPSPTPPSP